VSLKQSPSEAVTGGHALRAGADRAGAARGPAEELLEGVIEIAKAAGQEILRVYADGCVAERKQDGSPVTEADHRAQEKICTGLERLAPSIPIVSEENDGGNQERPEGVRFWLVDPLDGTKEFLNRNGEFTVNIAEIGGGKALRGVVYAPAKNRLFLGDGTNGAFEIETRQGEHPDFAQLRPIAVRSPAKDGLVAVASRSHRDSKTEEYLAHYPVKDFVTAGSSLKFCLVACGEADIYPRHGQTMEWDTAAGQAVLEAAGGSVRTLDGRPFIYGKADERFANPFFVARGRS
jgi:3'(2'), 5'-bisphosphate nucleotidase